MTIEQFRAIARERIPTPAEFVAAIEGKGWKVVVRPDGKPALHAPGRKGPLAERMAAFLSREPYRTGVLAVLDISPAHASMPAAPRPREWLWPGGMVQSEEETFSSFGHPDEHPGRASHWRAVGESVWLVIERKPVTPPPGITQATFDDGSPVVEWKWADGSIQSERDLFRGPERTDRPAWFRFEGDTEWRSRDANVPDAACKTRGDPITTDPRQGPASSHDGAAVGGVLPGARGPLTQSRCVIDA